MQSGERRTEQAIKNYDLQLLLFVILVPKGRAALSAAGLSAPSVLVAAQTNSHALAVLYSRCGCIIRRELPLSAHRRVTLSPWAYLVPEAGRSEPPAVNSIVVDDVDAVLQSDIREMQRCQVRQQPIVPPAVEGGRPDHLQQGCTAGTLAMCLTTTHTNSRVRPVKRFSSSVSRLPAG